MTDLHTCLVVNARESEIEMRDEAEERIAQARAICALAAASADAQGFINDLDKHALTAADALLGEVQLLFDSARKGERRVPRTNGRLQAADKTGAGVLLPQ